MDISEISSEGGFGFMKNMCFKSTLMKVTNSDLKMDFQHLLFEVMDIDLYWGCIEGIERYLGFWGLRILEELRILCCLLWGSKTPLSRLGRLAFLF